jgi:protein O-mannosyl-transferase
VPLVAMIAFLAVLWLLQRRSGAAVSRACFFAYFTVALLPALGLIDNFVFRFSLVFDHFQFSQAMRPLALTGAGLARAWNFLRSGPIRARSLSCEIPTPTPIPRYADTPIRFYRLWRPALCTGLLMVLGIASWQRAWLYKDQETLWSDTVARNPNCWMGHNNLGLALLHSGQIDGAIRHTQKAVEIKPYYVEAYNNLGNVLLHTGKSGEAMKQYQMALEINPNDAGDHYNLSVALAQTGQLDEAIAEDQKALGINPNYAEARINLGNVFLQKGQLREAIEQYQAAIKINPRLVEARANLGVALAQNGQLEDAITEFEAALRLNPNLGMVRNNLARAKMMQAAK